jgi:hypothetical protein
MCASAMEVDKSGFLSYEGCYQKHDPEARA